MNIFDYMNTIFYKKEIKEEDFDSKESNKVLLSYWLSHDKELISLVNKVNKNLWYYTDYQVFKIFYDLVPKKRRFISWTKKEKKKDETKIDKDIKEKFHLTESEISIYGN